MTKHEILLRLLEESRKYEHETLHIYTGHSWIQLEDISVGNMNLNGTSFETENFSITKGISIRIGNCGQKHFISLEHPRHITIGQITTTFLPLSRIIFISHEI